MNDGFVEVYAKSTGQKQWVPEHYLEHPVLGRDFEETPSSRANRDGDQPPAGPPVQAWTRAQLDQHASVVLGLDTSDLATKADVVAAIERETQHDQDDPDDPTPTDSDGTPPPDQPPAAGENQE
ncbi:hypothetical protein GUY44_07145 [Pimelobacter simplex]|uniref:Uncharacterized protein n=1 Tax=Nocardioides simplex TaxID=2045 RepID=A0A0A1DMJ4_NOCSI|nr:hypothetical protein [Pimelobacter simplex]AIY17783.1 hypothetical protein KR76_15250 [Pimelobacter simplex]MCG8150248.1 hypothetical protein [Pimelobacter simplex]GEB13542.1 hypothetical protein NSI01_18570 [Pimelobacter simplex]SFM71936.1 hypothetical protein SAMN05421671_3129 [Pimelobacter simplex]